MSGPFKLFSEPTNFLSLSDYGTILSVMERLKPKRVLEFGPGYSTLALVEGGAEEIVCLEDDPVWLETWSRRHSVFQNVEIRQFKYTTGFPIFSNALAGERFDFALVDGPHCTEDRPRFILWALEFASAVLVPTEDYGHKESSFLRPHISSLAEEFNCSLEWMETGPIAGGFALMVKR